MELKRYVYPLLRWWWLLVAATLVAAVSSFLVTLQQAPVYQARTTLMMGRAFDDPNPKTSEFWLAQQLAITYADIANRDVVRNATMEALGTNWLPPYKARALSNSQMIEIVVTDTSPQMAQLVANEVAHQLILQSPTSEREGDTDRTGFIQQQLDTLEAQILQTQDAIEQKQTELGSMVSARQINDTQNEISALQGKLNTLMSNYSALLANTQGGAINTVSVIEQAGLPKRPIGPAKTTSILVASMIGFALAAGAAYVLEYLDDTLKTPSDVERALGYPVIGSVVENSDWEEKRPFVAENPRHPISEAFRSVRTNLEFASVDQPLKTLLVTSADEKEGKTSVATNLAVVVAQGERKVVLIDADLRRPSVHKHMRMPNDGGMTDLFRGRVQLHNAMRLWKHDRLAVISAGTPPPNPAELLGSKRMDQVLGNLKEVADLIILDGPPFVVTDAAVLAAKVDGVLLVVRPGYTREAAAKSMVQQIRRSGANVVGVVLNRIPSGIATYYGSSVYGGYYSNSEYYKDPKPVTKEKARGLRATLSTLGSDMRSAIKPSPPKKAAPGKVDVNRRE